MVSEAGIEPAIFPSERNTFPLRHSEIMLYIKYMNLKELILELRTAGLTYDEISEKLSCSKGTISYHCNTKAKESQHKQNSRNRKRGLTELKMAHGGKCRACSYDICLQALHFHHIDSEQKDGLVSKLITQKGIAAATIEAAKCILLCGNCHCEVHAGKRDISHLKPMIDQIWSEWRISKSQPLASKTSALPLSYTLIL
jgi:ferredoxin